MRKFKDIKSHISESAGQLAEGKMGELHADIGDDMDKHIDQYKKSGNSEVLNYRAGSVAKRIAKQYKLKQAHAHKFVHDYMHQRLNEDAAGIIAKDRFEKDMVKVYDAGGAFRRNETDAKNGAKVTSTTVQDRPIFLKPDAPYHDISTKSVPKQKDNAYKTRDTKTANFIKKQAIDYNNMASESVDESEDGEYIEEMSGAGMSARAVHKHLKTNGWALTRTSGGHDVFTHPKSNKNIAVPRHKGDLKVPTVLSIMKDSRINEETVAEEQKSSKDDTKRRLKQVKDRKTGKLYDPDDAFEKLQKNPEYIAQMKRMGQEQGKGWPKRKEQSVSEKVEINEGRPSQAHPLEDHEYHKKTDAELNYIGKDAHAAAEAMKGHNTNAENKYRDQANDAATVRYWRKKNGMPNWYKKKYGHLKEEVVSEGLFGLSSSEKGKVQAHAHAISDIPGHWDHKNQTFTQKGWNEMHKALGGSKKHMSYAKKTYGPVKEEVDLVNEEARDTVEKDAQGKIKSWKHEGDWTKSKGDVTDKSGARHNARSRVRDLARKALKKSMTKEKSVHEAWYNPATWFDKDKKDPKTTPATPQTPVGGQTGGVIRSMKDRKAAYDAAVNDGVPPPPPKQQKQNVSESSEGIKSGKYKYHTETEVEFDKHNSKIYHYAVDHTGKKHSIDYTPYEKMKAHTFHKYVKLGLPKRQGIAPLQADQIDKMHDEKFKSVREWREPLGFLDDLARKYREIRDAKSDAEVDADFKKAADARWEKLKQDQEKTKQERKDIKDAGIEITPFRPTHKSSLSIGAIEDQKAAKREADRKKKDPDSVSYKLKESRTSDIVKEAWKMSGGYYVSFHKKTGKIGFIGNKNAAKKHKNENPEHALGYTGSRTKVGDIFGGYPKDVNEEAVIYESRTSDIVKEAWKSAKAKSSKDVDAKTNVESKDDPRKDTFQKDPEMTGEISKQ